MGTHRSQVKFVVGEAEERMKTAGLPLVFGLQVLAVRLPLLVVLANHLHRK